MDPQKGSEYVELGPVDSSTRKSEEDPSHKKSKLVEPTVKKKPGRRGRIPKNVKVPLSDLKSIVTETSNLMREFEYQQSLMIDKNLTESEAAIKLEEYKGKFVDVTYFQSILHAVVNNTDEDDLISKFNEGIF